MKRYALLKLQPAGFASHNLVIAEHTAGSEALAIKHFQTIFTTKDGQTLDDNGYLKVGEVTFCIAEYFNS